MSTLQEPSVTPADIEYIFITPIGIAHYLSRVQEMVTVLAGDDSSIWAIHTDVNRRVIDNQPDLRKYLSEIIQWDRDGRPAATKPEGLISVTVADGMTLVRLMTGADA